MEPLLKQQYRHYQTTEQWCKLLMSISGCVIRFCMYQVFWQHRHDFYPHTFLGRVFMEGLAFHYLSFHNIKLPFAEPHSSEAGRCSNEVSILTILPKGTPLVKVTNDRSVHLTRMTPFHEILTLTVYTTYLELTQSLPGDISSGFVPHSYCYLNFNICVIIVCSYSQID